jgi:signal transduction histidine kinase
VPFGVAIAEAGTTEMRLNPSGAAMLNVPPDVPIDPAVAARWKLFRDGRAVPIEERALFRALSRGEQISNEEYELVFPSGRRLAVMVSAAPICGRDGTVLGAVAAFVDVTPQKNLQIELDMRRREAEESSVRKSRFLAAVSHDIRTPANAISLLAELLDRTAGSPKLSEEVPEIARDLKTSALTLVNLVSDVLDLTRFDSGRIDLNETEFPLAQIIEDECRQLAPMARDKGLRFNCDLPPTALLIRADRVKLSRILGNLISNAIKFTTQGHVSIQGLHDSQNGLVMVRVTDTGPGIPTEHHERIFDEFFQLRHANPQQRDNGSGLGLAICRRLAVAMGGKIEVTSVNGHGSTFTLSLPASVVVPV